MKTSLSHLPEKKQFEISRISDIIKEVVKPEKIILFGSHAKGGWVEHKYTDKHGTLNEYISDYDFLVVTKDNPEKTYSQEATIMDRVDRYKPPVNLEIHEIDYINEGLTWGQYFFADIVNEGILLYDKGTVEFTEQKQLTPSEEKKKAQDYFDIWFEMATGFLQSTKLAYEDVLNSGRKLNVPAFTLHQATESLYYTILLVFTGYKPKLHNLWKLRKKTKQYSEDLFTVFKAETVKEEEELFDLLKRAYVEARYDQNAYHITPDELRTLIEKITIMTSIVERICKEKVASFEATQPPG